MQNNSFGYVILGVIILLGSIFVSFMQKSSISEYNIISSINGVRYEGIIYSDNRVVVSYNSCFNSNCYVDTKEYNYSKEKMESFKDLLNNYEFIEYNNEDYNFIVYNIKYNSFIDNYDSSLINVINNILLGKF